MMGKAMLVNCEKCGKTIGSVDKENKQFSFRFGKSKEREDSITPVVIDVTFPVKELKMKCFRKECRREYPDHWNIVEL